MAAPGNGQQSNVAFNERQRQSRRDGSPHKMGRIEFFYTGVCELFARYFAARG
jgi:hypothetical protein